MQKTRKAGWILHALKSIINTLLPSWIIVDSDITDDIVINVECLAGSKRIKDPWSSLALA